MNSRFVTPLALFVALGSASAISAQSPAAAPAKASAYRVFNLGTVGNEARYRVSEELASIGYNEVVGKTKDVKGRIVVDANGAVVKDSSKIIVNAQTLQTDSKRRDEKLKTQTLETDKFPQVTLVPVSWEGFTPDIPAGQEKTFSMVGDLTVRNVTKPTTWQVTARKQGNDIVGTAKTVFTLQYFNMEKPRAVMVMTVGDTVHLEYDFHFTPGAASAAAK